MPVQIVNTSRSMITIQCHRERVHTRVLRREYDRSTGGAFQRPVVLNTPRARRILVGSNKGLPDSLAKEAEVLEHEKAGHFVVTTYAAPPSADHAASDQAHTTQNPPSPETPTQAVAARRRRRP